MHHPPSSRKIADFVCGTAYVIAGNKQYTNCQQVLTLLCTIHIIVGTLIIPTLHVAKPTSISQNTTEPVLANVHVLYVLRTMNIVQFYVVLVQVTSICTVPGHRTWYCTETIV
jgi:phosphatidylserine synthase